jgi:pimeloyl-ACP methyl ester carboxylesterase
MDLMVPVSGGEVWAHDTGGDGQPVVLLHPGWGDSTIWEPVLSELASHSGLRVIRYDTRGYGRSPRPAAPYTALGDLTAVLDHLDVPPAVVVGHSGGGGTAIGLALARPEQVRALILLAPGTQDYPWPEEYPYFTEFGRLFTAGDQDGLVALGLRTWAAGGADPAAQAQVRSAVAAFMVQGDHEAPDPPAYPQLADIKVPSVVVVGDLDDPVVRDSSASIADRIPGCQTIGAPGADHLLPLRVPGLLAGLISEYAGQ